MSPYLKLTGRTFTIWILASLINGLLCGIFITLSSVMYFELIGNVLLVSICSLFFSAPGFFVFWLVLLFKISTHTTERALFRSALITGIHTRFHLRFIRLKHLFFSIRLSFNCNSNVCYTLCNEQYHAAF